MQELRSAPSPLFSRRGNRVALREGGHGTGRLRQEATTGVWCFLLFGGVDGVGGNSYMEVKDYISVSWLSWSISWFS